MPWRETSPMEQRLEFVREYATELFTMSELAEQYGISRKTGYKWVAEYAAHGAGGLCDRSRRPHHSPHATATELKDALLALRRRHPCWGAKKLLAVAARRGPLLDLLFGHVPARLDARVFVAPLVHVHKILRS